MFGAIAVIVNDAMAVAVHKDGSLLVRVDPTEDASLLENPHASRAEMGTGRSMSEGWIRVEPTALRSDSDPNGWLAAPIRYLTHRSKPEQSPDLPEDLPLIRGSSPRVTNPLREQARLSFSEVGCTRRQKS